MRKKIASPRKTNHQKTFKRFDQVTDHTYSSKPIEYTSTSNEIDQPSVLTVDQTCSPQRIDQPSTSQSTDPPAQDSQLSPSSNSSILPIEEDRSRIYRKMLSFLKRNRIRKVDAPCIDLSFNYWDLYFDFSRFLFFVNTYGGSSQIELVATVFPVFVHFYLMILHVCKNDDQDKKANDFFEKYFHLFHSAVGYRIPLKELHSLKSFSDVKQHPYFWEFWKSEYIVYLSDSVLKDLEIYIAEHACKTLGFVLRFRFHIKRPSTPNIVHAEKSINDVYRCNKSLYLDRATFSEDIRSAIEDLTEKNFPTISLIVLECKSSLSVDLNKNENEICIATESSSVLITPVLPDPMVDSKNILHVAANDMKKVMFEKKVTLVKYNTHRSETILAACGRQITLLNKDTGKISCFSEEHALNILDMDINPKVEILATSSRDNTCKLWNITTLEEIDTLKGNRAAVNSLRFHPNGMYIVTGSSDTAVRIRDIEHTGIIRTFLGHSADVFSVAVTLDGKVIASADAAGVIKFWDIRDKSEISEILSGTGDLDPGRKFQMSFNCDNILVFSDNHQIFRVIDIRNPTEKYQTKFLQNTPLLMRYSRAGYINILTKES